MALFIENFQRREHKILSEKEIRDNLMKLVCIKNGYVYGRFNRLEWLENLFMAEDDLDIICLCWRTKCSKCSRLNSRYAANIIFNSDKRNSSESFVKKYFNNTCTVCDDWIIENIRHQKPILLIIDVVLSISYIPESITLPWGDVYCLKFVQEAASESGNHFFCKIRLGSAVYSYNDQDGQAHILNGWPAHFHYPSIAIYDFSKNLLNDEKSEIIANRAVMKSSAKSFEIAIPITVAEQVTNKRFPRLQNVAKKVKSGHNSSFEHTSDSTSDESFTSRNRKRKG